MNQDAISLADRLNLPKKQRQVLLALAETGSFIPSKRLVDRLYGDDPDGGPLGADDMVHQYICRLRRRLAPHGVRIFNSRFVGYRLELEKPMSPTDIHSDPSCTFCGTTKKETRVLIEAPGSAAFICEQCVSVCVQTTIANLASRAAQTGAPSNG